jgi:hypothetical protein
MPISVVDYEALIKDPLSLGLFRNLVRMNPIIKLFPIVQKKSLVVKGQEWDELPTASFRDINEQFTDSTGKTKPVEERQAILGGSFRSDRVFEDLGDEQYRDPVQQQFDFYNVSIDRTLTDYVFNGDIDTNAKAFNGIYKRFGISGGFPSASQVSLDSSGDALKVLADATNAKAFFDGLDDAMYEAGLWGSGIAGVPKGALFMNKSSFKGMQRAARLTGYSINQLDLLGYTWHEYMGIPLVDVGFKRDQETEIILNTYDPGDGGDDATRIYCVRFSAPDGDIDSPGADGLSLLQAAPYKVLPAEEYAEYVRWAVQWILGLVHIGDNHSAAMLEGFKMAAS